LHGTEGGNAKGSSVNKEKRDRWWEDRRGQGGFGKGTREGGCLKKTKVLTRAVHGGEGGRQPILKGSRREERQTERCHQKGVTLELNKEKSWGLGGKRIERDKKRGGGGIKIGKKKNKLM